MAERYKRYMLLADQAKNDPLLIQNHVDSKIPLYLQSELDEIETSIKEFSDTLAEKDDFCRDNAFLQRLQKDAANIRQALNVYQ